MFTLKNCKKLYNLLRETIFQAFLHVFFIFFAFFTPAKQPYFEISDDHPLNNVGDARDR
jgi:hypothetical protein